MMFQIAWQAAARPAQRRCRWTACLVLVCWVLAGCGGVFQAERQYLQTMVSHAQRTLDTLNTLQQLADQPRLDDADWQQQVDRQITTLRDLIDEARQIEPPEQFLALHSSYLDMMNTLDELVVTYERAAELRDHSMLQESEQRLEQARTTLDDLRQRIRDVSGQ